ncbi:MAG TPA: PEP-utilizing enzyme [Candidatus Paceibacterota bacterium]
MTSEEIKKKVLQYKWEHWADRSFGAFILSLFRDANSRASMRKIGVDVEWHAHLFQKGAWYKSQEVWDIIADDIQKNFLDKDGNLFEVVSRCEKILPEGKARFEEITGSSMTPQEKISGVHEVLAPLLSYVWLTHGFEHVYLKKLKAEVPRHMEGDVDKNIGDLSFPVKKNAHNFFEEALRGTMPLDEVQRRFAWIKARDGFSDGFTLRELADERERLRNAGEKEEYVRPTVPGALKELSLVAQELVYFRTMRTDILYELLYFARPILEEVAAFYKLQFKELRDYCIQDLISGKLEYYEYSKVSSVAYQEHFAIIHGDVFEDNLSFSNKEVKGVIAFKGKVSGVAKIVMNAHDIDKVEEGDILFAPTTAPSYIIGMQKAAAFVTDEGGITSHASIVAREMKKPCVIGTKLGTRTFKDGDMVEVDAENGIVKIL